MIHYFNSQQASVLPALTGQPGALRVIARTCLVDGAGPAPVTSISVSGGVATATFGAAHGFIRDNVIAVANATPAALSGLQRVLSVPTSTTLTFATTAADGAASGSITAKLAPAGWEQRFLDGETAVFRPSAFESFGVHLRIDDSGATNARVRGYSTMSDVSTGAGPVPTEAQFAGGLYWGKSFEDSALSRPWIVAADSCGVYFMGMSGMNNVYSCYYAGDLDVVRPSDANGWLLTGSQSATEVNSSNADAASCGLSSRLARPCIYLAGSATGAAAAVPCSIVGTGHNGAYERAWSGADSYAPPSGAALTHLPLCRVEVWDADGLRGFLPGAYHIRAPILIDRPTVVDGTADLLGSRLLLVPVGVQAANDQKGVMAIDITGSWGRRL